MNGFVAIPPVDDTPADAVVVADGWFPAVAIAPLRDALRLRGEITHARLVAAIEGAMLTVLRDLSDWRSGWARAGVASLDAVDADSTLNGRPRLVALWERAVRSAAAADLIDAMPDMTATGEGQLRAEVQAPASAEYRRQSLLAVRDILGVTRTAVELI